MLFTSVALPQENVSGIFITMDYPRKTRCENELKSVIGKTKVCLSKKPIIEINELKYVGDIQYDPINKVYYIDAGLTPSGIQTLNKTNSSLPTSRFALVVDNEIVCIFQIPVETKVSVIRMGEDAHLEDLKAVRKSLEKLGL